MSGRVSCRVQFFGSRDGPKRGREWAVGRVVVPDDRSGDRVWVLDV